MPDATAPGLAALLEMLEQEAHAQAEHVLAEARERAALRLREADQAARAIEAEADAAGAAEGEREARRRVALARIETRRELLQVREANAQHAIDLAVGRLAGEIDGADGARLAAAAVRVAARALGVDRVRLRGDRLDRRALAASLHGGPAIEWDEAPGPDAPGVLVLAPDRHRMVDMTLDGIVRRRHDDARRAATAVFAAQAAT